MSKITFYGITINNIDPILLKYFDNTVVSWKRIKSNNRVIYCLYYQDKCNSDELRLSIKEQQQFQNDLEMVESDELYDGYNDDFGYHSFELDRNKIVIKKKARKLES